MDRKVWVRAGLLASGTAALLIACASGSVGEAPRGLGDESGVLNSEEGALTSCTTTNDCTGGQTCCSGLCKNLISIGTNGKISYGCYAAQAGPHLTSPAADNTVPDFSYAGYMRGGVAIPNTAPLVLTLAPRGGGLDDSANLQTVLDNAAALTATNPRVAVQLFAGTFNLDSPLTMSSSRVTLRGSGQGSGGTVLNSRISSHHELITVKPSSLPTYPAETAGSAGTIVGRLPVGATTVVVSGGGPWTGCTTTTPCDVVVVRQPTNSWIQDIHMDQLTNCGDPNWIAADYAVPHPRRVVGATAVSGGTRLTLDIPIVDGVETTLAGGYVAKIGDGGFIEQVGVEDLKMVAANINSSNWTGHWSGIRLARTKDSWVRRVTVEKYGFSAVRMADGASFNTVEEVAHLDPQSPVSPPGNSACVQFGNIPDSSYRYSFFVESGVGNLFQRCFTRNSRHSLVTGKVVTGPQVWLDSAVIQANADQGPHLNWSTGLLFDNIHTEESAVAACQYPTGGGVRVLNTACGGTSHGWTGAQMMIYNSGAPLMADAPAGGMNWVVGGIGKQNEGNGFGAPDEAFGIWQFNFTTVKPRSLYLQQLKDRLGQAAVDAVTTPQQRNGRVWEALAKWQGNGNLSDFQDDPTCAAGTPDGSSAACCPKSCAVCGGPSLPAACRAGPILSGTRSCLDFPAPCFRPDPTCNPAWGGAKFNGDTRCCKSDCSQCGGSGCPSGCCIGTRTCGDFPAPCVMADSECNSGVIAAVSQTDTTPAACCSGSCSQCGGTGCSGAGPAGSQCCVGSLTNSCDSHMPACVMD